MNGQSPWNGSPEGWADDAWAQPQNPPTRQLASDDWLWESPDAGAQQVPHHHAWDQPRQPESGGSRTGLFVGLTVAAVVALAGIGVGTYFVLDRSGNSDESTSLSSSGSGSGVGAGGQSEWRSDGTSSAPTSSAPTSTAPARPTTNAEAEAELDRLVADAVPRIEDVEYQWIPQLSSKKPGFFAEGRDWDHLAILEEFESFRSSYPNAALIRSSDWGVFEPGWYVTVVVEPSPSPEPVLSWCLREGYDRNHCLAKNIQRDGSTTGTTRLN